MTQFRKMTVATIVGASAIVLISLPSFAADNTQLSQTGTTQPTHSAGGAQGMHSGMMGQGTHSGMMGQGMHSGMMGQGMHSGMMGQGMHSSMMGQGVTTTLVRDLSVVEARHLITHHLDSVGNKRLKLGEVKEVDADKITAEIVTLDNSLVQRIEIDRHTGVMKHIE